MCILRIVKYLRGYKHHDGIDYGDDSVIQYCQFSDNIAGTSLLTFTKKIRFVRESVLMSYEFCVNLNVIVGKVETHLSEKKRIYFFV